jgi:hypothetical protein
MIDFSPRPAQTNYEKWIGIKMPFYVQLLYKGNSWKRNKMGYQNINRQ